MSNKRFFSYIDFILFFESCSFQARERRIMSQKSAASNICSEKKFKNKKKLRLKSLNLVQPSALR